jgi:hypothetical protein
MLPDVLSSGRIMILAVLLLTPGLSACGSASQADNAERFREQAPRSVPRIAFVASDDSRPGLVAGVAGSGKMRVEFVFSFGPGPDPLSGVLRRRGTNWFDVGDRFESWVEKPPAGSVVPEAGRYVRIALALEDVACRVVTGRSCAN